MIIAADIGKSRDPTAIVWYVNGYVANAQKVALGTSYTEQFRILRTLVGPGASFVMDAGGVGRPLFDMLPKSSFGIITTTGDEMRRDPQNPNVLFVPKTYLFAPLVQLMADKRLGFSDNPGCAALQKELSRFRISMSAGGVKIGVKRTKAGHGDLGHALAMAVFLDRVLGLPAVGTQRMANGVALDRAPA